MDISQHVRAIISFIEAADALSFAAAARKLKISPAAVSKNIASLENVLGIRLMNRTTRKISLTKEGAVFLEHSRIALRTLEGAVDRVMQEKQDHRGHVKISTSSAFGADYIVPELPGLIEHYANLTVEVDFDDSVVDLVNNGYDIAIRGGQIVDSSLISRTICRMHTVLVASPGYLATHGIPTTSDDLSQHVPIARKFIDGRISPWKFKSTNGEEKYVVPQNAKITLTNPKSLTTVAVAGHGIAQVGIHNVLDELEQGLLNIVLFDEHDPGTYEMVIQYPHRSFIAPRVQITVEYLLNKLKAQKNLTTPRSSLRKYCA